MLTFSDEIMFEVALFVLGYIIKSYIRVSENLRAQANVVRSFF